MSKNEHTKPTNPKDIVGSGKLPMELVPDTINVEVALAYLEGALKYGRFNWRISGVRASVYRAAIGRHLAEWWNGEDRDSRSRVKHLASVIASAGILLDAELCGKLNDDRPPRASGISQAIQNAGAIVSHLKELFKDHSPHQYTIEDTDNGDDTGRPSEASDRRAAKKPRRVQTQARAKRNGRASA